MGKGTKCIRKHLASGAESSVQVGRNPLLFPEQHPQTSSEVQQEIRGQAAGPIRRGDQPQRVEKDGDMLGVSDGFFFDGADDVGENPVRS